MNGNPLPTKPLYNQRWEAVLATLRMAIIRGVLKPGAHLLEVQLAEQLHVSRGPVREALVRLEQEGLVINQPYRGKFVADLSANTIRETYSLRRVLEGFAAELAVEKLQPAQVEGLQLLFERMMAAVNQQRFEEFADLDLEFHRRFIAAAEHNRLLQMWETLTGVTHAFIVVNASLDHENYRVIAEGHAAILQALADRDVAAAKATLDFHLREAERRLYQVMAESAQSEAGTNSNDGDAA